MKARSLWRLRRSIPAISPCLKRGGLVILAIALASLHAPSVRGQDAHYWNLSYGTQATLLGGAVIGSASDLSATYYNPGMLAVNREQGLLLGANVYTFQSVRLEGAPGEGSSSSRVAPAPGLVAGRVPVDSTVLGGIAYSILSRHYFKTDIQGRIVQPFDIVGNDGIPEQVASELTFSADLTETWLGATAFRLVRPGLGVGLSTYAALRNQSLRRAAQAGALTAAGNVSSSSQTSDIEYYSVRLLWKLGVGLDLGALTLGATVTTPSVSLFGSGSSYLNQTKSRITTPTDTARDELLVASNQQDVDALWKSSWAVGLGAGYRFGDARIHLSAEWYAHVGPYDVLALSPYTGQSDGEEHREAVRGELESVLNAGIGLEYTLSPSASLYGSLTTDRAAVESGTANDLAATMWDLYHVSGGAVLKFEALDLTVGLSYAGGSETLGELSWRRSSSIDDKEVLIPDETQVRSFTLTGVLAFTFRL